MQLNDSGYGIVSVCLSKRECEEIAATLSTAQVSRSRAGARHLMSNPAVATLANDRRLRRIAAQWLGCEAAPFKATLFEKSGGANWLIPWHQDTALPLAGRFDRAGWGPWSEKAGAAYAHAPAWALARVIAVRVHLDASLTDNGPLRVLPGSHAGGVLTDRGIRELVETNEQVECCVPEGGVIAMRPLIVHCSSKAGSAKPRRVLHFEYADSLILAEGIRLAVL